MSYPLSRNCLVSRRSAGYCPAGESGSTSGSSHPVSLPQDRDLSVAARLPAARFADRRHTMRAGRRLPRLRIRQAFHLLVGLLLVGCAQTDHKLTYVGEPREVEEYFDSEMRLENPVECDHEVDPTAGTGRPHT